MLIHSVFHAPHNFMNIHNKKITLKFHLFIFLIDDLRLLVPLEPHHVLGVESPTLLFEGLRCEVLGLRALHVIEYEE